MGCVKVEQERTFPIFSSQYFRNGWRYDLDYYWPLAYKLSIGTNFDGLELH